MNTSGTKAAFDPLPDITAYEVAYVVAHLGGLQLPPNRGVYFTDAQWDGLPRGVRRHFAIMRGEKSNP